MSGHELSERINEMVERYHNGNEGHLDEIVERTTETDNQLQKRSVDLLYDWSPDSKYIHEFPILLLSFGFLFWV